MNSYERDRRALDYRTAHGWLAEAISVRDADPVRNYFHIDVSGYDWVKEHATT
jgi:hypothetical protein